MAFVLILFLMAYLTRRAIWIDFGAGMGLPSKPDPNLGVY